MYLLNTKPLLPETKNGRMVPKRYINLWKLEILEN